MGVENRLQATIFLRRYRDLVLKDLQSEQDEELKVMLDNLVSALDLLLESNATLTRIKRAVWSI
jgi:hypothetical protein